ncbi:TraB/GumN family protein [Agriterribacter sp.]|uniref:TraB/GumN family protein n=1 Tax=Agriterribacter sp. TaxID=2821509 RepID=UPI002D1B76FA|nr:TraB/GumN family protein [Agriterribacter sp.]HTN05623.1 TraB/GumN family protein [Agriterribacter sp.]
MKETRYKNSLLYKISEDGLRKPSYLFGTMHMICARDFEIPDKVRRTLSKCNTFYMEVDLGSADEVNMMQQQELAAQDIAAGLSPGEKIILNNLLIKQLDLTLEDAQHLPAVELINQMAAKAVSCDDIKIAELELLKIAMEKGLRSAGLETALEQLEIAKQVFNGREILLQLQLSENDNDLFEKMVNAYHQENLKELAALITHKRFMSAGAYNILVIRRNQRWAEMIPELIRERSAFIAVGAGHLPGGQGLLQLLTEQGFSVNPVYK